MNSPVAQGPLSRDQIQAQLARSPFIAFLNPEVTAVDPEKGTLTMRWPMRPEMERGGGSKQWHGGPIAAIIDTVGDYALVVTLLRPLPTLNFRVDYLRPAIDTALTSVATVRRAGRSVGLVDIDVFDDRHALVAVGRAAYATSPPPAK